MAEQLTRWQQILLDDRYVIGFIGRAFEQGKADTQGDTELGAFFEQERSMTRDERILYDDSFVEQHIAQAYKAGRVAVSTEISG